jgi:hypothetical protein
MSTAAVNLSQSLSSEPWALTVSDLVSLKNKGAIYCDSRFMQRLLKKWSEDRMSSYIETCTDGGNLSTTFLFVDVDSVIEWQKEQLRDNPNNNAKNELEKLNHFEKLAADGVKYLLTDGQHRTDAWCAFLNNEVQFNSPDPVFLKIPGEQGSILLAGYFEDLPEAAQDYIRDMPLNGVIYKTGSMDGIIKNLVSVNSGSPMTTHEKRIINFNGNNNWVNELCDNDRRIADLIDQVSSVPKHYEPLNKGDTHWICDTLLWVMLDQKYEYEDAVLDAAFGRKPDANLNSAPRHRALVEDIFKVILDGCSKYVNSGHSLAVFSMASLQNLVYHTSYLLNPTNHLNNKYGKVIHDRYKILDTYEFVKDFFDQENDRLNADGTWEVIEGSFKKNGDPRLRVHELSYRKHNADLKHQSKESRKGVGGSKYTFDEYARLMYILRDLENRMTYLVNNKIVQKVVERGSVDRAKVAAQLGVKLSDMKGKHVDHCHSLASGGEDNVSNYEVIDGDSNLGKGRGSSIKPSFRKKVATKLLRKSK